jgi:hypothetical protein
MDSVDEALFIAATQVTVHNGKKTKFWLSSWVNGGSSALIFPDLFNHTRRQQRSVTEAMHSNTWISDLMHNPSASLLVDYMLLWILVDAAQFNPQDPIEDEIVWTRSANDNYLAKNSIRDAVRWQPGVVLPDTAMEYVGAITLHGVHLASSSGQNLDGRSPTPLGMEEWLFLPSMHQESRNRATPLHGMPHCSPGLARSQQLDAASDAAPTQLGLQEWDGLVWWISPTAMLLKQERCSITHHDSLLGNMVRAECTDFLRQGKTNFAAGDRD